MPKIHPNGIILIDLIWLIFWESWEDRQLEIAPSMCSWYATLLCCFWTQTLCKIGLCIPANDDSPTWNTSRCPQDIWGGISSSETEQLVLGWNVHWSHYWAGAHEKYKNTWRLNKRQRIYWLNAWSEPLNASMCKHQQCYAVLHGCLIWGQQPT